MKKLVKYILFVLLMQTVCIACTDLGETVYDRLPTDEFGSTPEQINAIVGPAYRTLKDVSHYDGVWGASEMTSDVMVAPTRLGGDWWDGGQYMEQCLQTWTARSPSVENLYNNCVNGVTTVNSILIPVQENTLITTDVKNRYIAELRGLRAYWYYNMVDCFGNVPLVTDFKDVTPPSITPRAKVYDFIIKELKEIMPYLRDDVSDASYGKFTKGAAHTLLAKMYLNSGEWKGEPNWEGVVAECDSVMQMPYIIERDWKVNFAVHNEISREIILPICFSAADGGNDLHWYTLHYLDPIALGFTGGMWNGICAQPPFVKLFDDNDQRKAGSFLIGPMIDPNTGEVLITTANRPLNHTVDLAMIPGTEKTDASGNPTLWGEVNQEDGARINKWVYEKGMMNTEMENDMAIFRLADVYLMKAEALVRLGRDNAAATQLVNTIRERAFGDSNHNYATVTLQNIYDERGFELAFEFSRRQDMIRFGTYLQPKYLKPYITESYRKLMPIPFTAWQKNNKLVQNPGYPAF